MKRAIVFAVAFAVVTAGISAGMALATPPSGTVTTEFGRSTVDHFGTSMGQGDIVVTENSYAPGGYSGWHSHPGKVVATVQRGAFTLYRGDDPTCTGKTYAAGQVFIERPGIVYFGRNEGAVSTVLNATFFAVPVGGSIRIDQPDPGNCSF
jgi:quercetin dioxygenase-like cupin family protein